MWQPWLPLLKAWSSGILFSLRQVFFAFDFNFLNFFPIRPRTSSTVKMCINVVYTAMYPEMYSSLRRMNELQERIFTLQNGWMKAVA
jgi:hypothetical protein